MTGGKSFIGLVAVATVGVFGCAASPASADSTICVGASPGCFHSLQAAVTAAPAGSTVRLRTGVFSGGVNIDKDLHVVGAGAGLSIISGGGGSVLTIGRFGVATEPTVTISGVTITGGRARTSAQSIPVTGRAGVMALGGGIDVPPDTSGSSGAAVTVSDSVITGNLAAPVRTQPIGPPCPSGPCPFALAGGGGIATWGPLTLDHTVVTDNRVGTATGLSTVASDAEGGGIDARNGPFVIRDSVISDNEVSASGPDARFADGGGLLMEDGVLTMTGTTVEHNDVRLAVAWPDSVETGALAGGAHVSDPASLVRDSVVSHNSVEMTNSVGGAYAFSGGLHSDADFPVDHTTVSDNTVTSATIGASTGEASADSGAGELADISHSVLDGNTVFVSAVDGKAEADGGAAISDGNLTDTIVSGNRLIARSPHGSAGVFGGGILALALDPGLTLRGDTFSGNQGSARGMTGVAQGGAIYTVAISTPPTAPLILISSTITGNVLTRVPGTARAGGGIFASDPVIRRHTVISGNQPGQCTGC